LGKQIDIPVISSDSKDVMVIADEALKQAHAELTNLLIFDTAGRLHIDTEMMDEVARLKEHIKPDYIFFVADSMTGQDAVTVAHEFYDKLAFDAVILTKLDGDARGGAALSIKAVTGRPVAFVSTGEKIPDLEIFYPDRMASRILGMGDVLSLIEKAEETMNVEEEEKLARKMLKNQFTLNDFLKQLQSIKKMGPLESVIRMIPGLGSKLPADLKIDDNALKHVEAIIQSMTYQEREKPHILNGSRRLRIAKGCGRPVMEVNRLMRQFEDMKKMMKKMNSPRGMKQLESMMKGQQ
jgi:signal recognition particle subunit SRP54